MTKADRSLGFAIQTCFISPSSYPDKMSEYIIIENICPKDESVKFYNIPKDNFPIPHALTDKKRFSFMFRSIFNTSLLFLHCEVTLCTKKEKDTQGLAKVSICVLSQSYNILTTPTQGIVWWHADLIGCVATGVCVL